MTDHAAVVQGMAAGVCGAVLALLGVDAQQLATAFVACSLGAVFAPPVSAWKARALFLAAVSATAIAASAGGPILASMLPGTSLTGASKLVALGVGIWLHPAIQLVATLAPKVAEWGLSVLRARTGGGTQ